MREGQQRPRRTAGAARPGVTALLALMLALPAVSAPAAPAAETQAVDDFAAACLATGPGFDGALKIFRARGYTDKTHDLRILSRAGGARLGGIGVADYEGQAEVKKPNGCLVYLKGVHAKRMVRAVQARLKTRAIPYGTDTYWPLKLGDKMMLAFVSPKTSGPYAGYTLLMVVPYKAPAGMN